MLFIVHNIIDILGESAVRAYFLGDILRHTVQLLGRILHPCDVRAQHKLNIVLKFANSENNLIRHVQQTCKLVYRSGLVNILAHALQILARCADCLEVIA